MGMGIGAGEETGPGGTAQRGGDKSIGKMHPFITEPVQPRRFHHRMSQLAHGIPAVIIGEDFSVRSIHYSLSW